MNTLPFVSAVLLLSAAVTAPLWVTEMVSNHREAEAEDYSARVLRDQKERECEADTRCAAYDRRTGQWVWKPGQTPVQVIQLQAVEPTP